MKRLAAVVLFIVVCAPARGQTPAETKATIEYVRALQTEEGSFLPAKGAKMGGLRATSAGLRALKYLGGEPRDKQPCRKFVASCFDKQSGGSVLDGSCERTFKFILSASADDNDLLPEAMSGFLYALGFLL